MCLTFLNVFLSSSGYMILIHMRLTNVIFIIKYVFISPSKPDSTAQSTGTYWLLTVTRIKCIHNKGFPDNELTASAQCFEHKHNHAGM